MLGNLSNGRRGTISALQFLSPPSADHQPTHVKNDYVDQQQTNRIGRELNGSLHTRDYYGWIQRNVYAIRAGRIDRVDWANIAEELEDMGKSEKRAWRSQLARLMHIC
jgi:Domain of unknown function DUF29